MSLWTHATCVFLIHCNEQPDFDQLFGKEVYTVDSWDDCSDGEFDKMIDSFADAEAHPEEYMPFGSDGSLSRIVEQMPDGCYSVVIGGHLRNVYDLRYVRDWFDKCCDRCGHMLRKVAYAAELN